MKALVNRHRPFMERTAGSGEKPGGLTAPLEEFDGLFVEAHERVGPEPSPFMGDNAVGKVTPCIQKCESGLDGRHVSLGVFSGEQSTNGRSNPFVALLIAFQHYPHELAQDRKRQCDQIGFRQRFLCNRRLDFVIFCKSSEKHICIYCDLHSSPAHPFAAISLISSIDNGFRPSCFSMPNASEILPVGLTARILTSPPGRVSTVIFSPGWTPRWRSNSFRSVICPLADTVIAFIRRVLSAFKVRKKYLTFKGEVA